MNKSQDRQNTLVESDDESSDSNQPQEETETYKFTGAARRRFLWWVKQGKSFEEAKELALKPYSETPEYIEIKKANDYKQTKQKHKSTKSKRILETDVILMGIKAKTSMSDTQIQVLKKCVIKCIGGGAYEGEGPHFCGCYSRCGIFVLKCTDEHTVNWVTTVFPTVKPWDSAKLTLLNDSEIKSEFSLYFRRKQSNKSV